MAEDDYNSGQISLILFPTEILVKIFTKLPGRDLGRSRGVCTRWYNIIDPMLKKNNLWRQKCEEEFPNAYEAARAKAREGLNWFSIFRTLALWPRLATAKEVRHDFALARGVNDEIRNFEVLPGGIVGVHKRSAVIYYDIETLQPSRRETIPGDYMTYIENEDTLVISSYHSHLFVIHKVIIDRRLRERNATIDEVKFAILLKNQVFYATLDNDIAVCQLDDDLESTIITHCDETVMSIGYTNKHLHVLTYDRNIYTLKDNGLVLSSRLDEHNNFLNQIFKYNLFEFVDWRTLMQWTTVRGGKIPPGPLQDIITLRTYGDVVFVGCNWGIFYIYYAPYINGEFDIYKSRPVKQYNFMEHTEPVFTMCPILQVDCIEADDGHTVVIALPKKIVTLDFIHGAKEEESSSEEEDDSDDELYFVDNLKIK